jgi:hypothetical protein
VPIKSPEYWEDKAAWATEEAGKTPSASIRLGLLAIAKHYVAIAAQTRLLGQHKLEPC